MANLIKIKRSNVHNKVPQTTDLELGELALNTYDGKLFLKKNDGQESIVQLGQFGYTGSVGYTGSQGVTGFTGSQGIQGDLGYTGSKGDIGYTGSRGEVGYTGSKGDQGVIGYTGSKGAIGYTGSIGASGLDYQFSTTTTTSSFTTGEVRYNDVVIADVTKVYLSFTTESGILSLIHI